MSIGSAGVPECDRMLQVLMEHGHKNGHNETASTAGAAPTKPITG